MNSKRFIRYATMSALMVVSLSAKAQLELSCTMDWSALTDIDTAKPDRLINGIKASDWTKEDVDLMLVKEKECARTETGPETLRQARLNSIETQAYPNALRTINARDQRLLAEKAAQSQAEQVAQTQVDPAPSGQQAAPMPEQHQPIQQQAEPAQPTQQQEAVQDNVDSVNQRNLWIALIVIGGSVAIWLWNKFIRNRCPSCKSTDFDRTSETEVDRWRGSKQVSERNTRGTKTRHVQATFVHVQFEYRCNHCQHEWTKIRKEELGDASKLTRFFAGF